ncbi:MAG: LptF/LptG family permease [Gemmatimonadaceae bacterium]
MKILTKYVLKEHVGPFVFALASLTSLMLLQYIGKRLGELVGKGLPWRVLAEFFVLTVPFTVAMTLPMAVLVAVLYAYSRLASENEITAMRANGLNMRSLLLPTLAAGAVVALIMLVFNDQVLSRANHQLAVLSTDIARTKPSFALKEQIINPVVEQKLYLRASHIDRGSQHMTGVTIWDLTDPQHRRTIYADSGTLGVAENRTDLVLHLYDGMMQEVPTMQPEQFTRLFYKRDLLRVRNVTNSFEASDADSAAKSDREMTVCEMQAAFADADFRWRSAAYDLAYAQAKMLTAKGATNVKYPVAPVRNDPWGLGRLYCGLLSRFFSVKKLQAAPVSAVELALLAPQAQAQATVQAPPPRVPPSAGGTPAPSAGGGVPPAMQAPPGVNYGESQLTLQSEEEAAVSREKIDRYMRLRYDIEIQKKFSLAAACIIFVLLGPPIALRFPRGGVGLVIGVSFSVFALYYVGLIGGETLADSEIISPFWAMWGANILLLVVGLGMVSRMNKVSGGTRGGDWSELREAFRQFATRVTGRGRGRA